MEMGLGIIIGSLTGIWIKLGIALRKYPKGWVSRDLFLLLLNTFAASLVLILNYDKFLLPRFVVFVVAFTIPLLFVPIDDGE